MDQGKLKKLECPFTWDIDEVFDGSIDQDYRPHDEEDIIPILKFMRLAIDVFAQLKAKNDPVEVLKKLESCDEQVSLIELENPKSYSPKVVRHVLESTRYFVFSALNMKEEAEETLKKIDVSPFDSKVEKSTLVGLKCVCWVKFHRMGREKAASLARQALANAPDCDVWHFALGKALRRIRRDTCIGHKPGQEEMDAFSRAYEISKNVVYGLFVAQMYREDSWNDWGRRQKALKLYEEIYRNVNSLDGGEGPKNTVLLRLALGFIRLGNMRLAKGCLERVEEKSPEDSMFLHYMGIFEMKAGNWAPAAHYMEKAADSGNVSAARQYLQCMQYVDRISFDPTEFLEKFVQKYQKIDDLTLQNFYLDMATGHMMKTRKGEAYKSYLKAIEIDPKSKILTDYRSAYNPSQRQNVYTILDGFLEATDNNNSKDFMDTVQKLKKHCGSYFSTDNLNLDVVNLRL